MAHQQIDYRLAKSPGCDSSHSTAKRRQIESEFRKRLNRHIEADLPATLTWRDGRAMRRERVRVLRMVGRQDIVCEGVTIKVCDLESIE